MQNENARPLVQKLLRTLRPWQQGIKPSVACASTWSASWGWSWLLSIYMDHGNCWKKNAFLLQIILLNYVKWVSTNIFTPKKKKDGALQCSGLKSLKPSLQWIHECCLAWGQHINSPPTAPSPQRLGLVGWGGKYIVSGSFLLAESRDGKKGMLAGLACCVPSEEAPVAPRTEMLNTESLCLFHPVVMQHD